MEEKKEKELGCGREWEIVRIERRESWDKWKKRKKKS
jgi:hypothetical protein